MAGAAKKGPPALALIFGEKKGKGGGGDMAEDMDMDMDMPEESGDEPGGLPPGFSTAVEEFGAAETPEERAEALYRAIELCKKG